MSRSARFESQDDPQVLNNVFPVSRETEERLRTFVDLLMRWQAAQNLVAPSTLPEVWRRHVADSLQIMRYTTDVPRVWADFGSGAGFPGLAIAIAMMEAMHEHSDGRSAHVHLIESNQRKAAFLRTVIRETQCPATVHAARIEDITADIVSTVSAVTARALADLETLCRHAAPFSARGARAFFHKGRNFQTEVMQASHVWSFDLIEEKSLIDPDSRILILSDIRSRRASGKG